MGFAPSIGHNRQHRQNSLFTMEINFTNLIDFHAGWCPLCPICRMNSIENNLHNGHLLFNEQKGSPSIAIDFITIDNYLKLFLANECQMRKVDVYWI